MSEGGILVAFSGGPDSVALCVALWVISKTLPVQLAVGHVNHDLRENALDDEHFCRDFAGKLGVKFFSSDISQTEFDQRSHLSLETAAREVRYEKLEAMRKASNAEFIAFGHHADDQAETVLNHVLRGTGIRGLAGVPMRNQIHLRPLLGCSKAEILQFLNEYDIPFCEDYTNLDTRFNRNKLRHELIPLLEQEFNPRIKEALNRLAQIAGEVEAFLEHEAKVILDAVTVEKTSGKIVLDIKGFWNYFKVSRKYALRLAIEEITARHIRPSFIDLERIESLMKHGASGEKAPLHGSWLAMKNHHFLVISQAENQSFYYECQAPSTVNHNDKWQLTFSVQHTKPKNIKTWARPDLQAIDAAKVEGNLVVRSTQPGDSFFPLGLRGKKKVSDYFIDKKVPLHRRTEIPIVACNSGIIWIVGYHLDERFKITESSATLVKMEFKDTRS